MPRLFHRPPKYALHKGTKQAVVSIGGKRVYLGPYGSKRSHLKYQELIKQWQEDRHEQKVTAKAKTQRDAIAEAITPVTLRDKRFGGLTVTINELMLVYRRHARDYYRKRGKVTREAELIEEIMRLLRKHHGGTRLENFGPVALGELREKMIDDLDWSRSHINKQVTRLIAMFKWAAEKELCPGSVAIDLKSLAGLKKGRTRARETRGVSCVADSIVEATLAHLPETVADMVRLQRLTGARPGEVCALRPDDIDRSGEVWVYTPAEHKTEHHGKQRAVVIGPLAQKLLLPYLDREPQSHCFSPAESEERRRQKLADQRTTRMGVGNSRGSNRVASPQRRPSDCYDSNSYRRVIHRACERAEVEKWSPNRLRHTAATEIRKKFGLEAAQVICGHQSADVTQVYAERDLDLAMQVAKEMG